MRHHHGRQLGDLLRRKDSNLPVAHDDQLRAALDNHSASRYRWAFASFQGTRTASPSASHRARSHSTSACHSGEGISAGWLQRLCQTCSSNRHATPEFSLIPSSATKSGWMRPMVSTKLASRSTSLLADGVLWRGTGVPQELQPASLRRRRRWRGRPAQWNWRPGRCLRIPHPETMSRRLIRSAFSASHLASCQSRVSHRAIAR